MPAPKQIILEAIQKAENSYKPSQEVADALAQKTLVMLIGPVAIGKSFIGTQIVKSDPEFEQTTVLTTREQRPDDLPGHFRFKSHEVEPLTKILNDIQKGDLVQYMVHTTTGNIYGTALEDYKGTYNLLPTISNVVNKLAQLPFSATYAIYLTARPEIWQMWLDSRYPTKNAERTKRIKEAITSLQWALADEQRATISWVENNIQTPERTIEDIINIVKYKDQGDPTARQYAEQMLELAINEE